MLPPPTNTRGCGSLLVFILSIASLTISCILAYTRLANSKGISFTFSLEPTSANPKRTAMSVAVMVFPPNTKASSVILYPTLSGMIVPPPSASEIKSGILKFVRTPPISTAMEDSLGNP